MRSSSLTVLHQASGGVKDFHNVIPSTTDHTAAIPPNKLASNRKKIFKSLYQKSFKRSLMVSYLCGL